MSDELVDVDVHALLPPAYLELHELLKQVPHDKGYPYPTEILRRTVMNRGYTDPTDDPAFKYLASFLKQKAPTVRLLHDIYGRSDSDDFSEWMLKMNRIYYPVYEVLILHAKVGFLAYRRLDDKMEYLAQNIIHTLGEKPPRSLHFRREWKLNQEQELTIALAYAQLCNLQEHSHLLVPERASGHWSRVIKDDISECLLDHEHDPETVRRVLTGRALRSVAELTHMLDINVPALSIGAL